MTRGTMKSRKTSRSPIAGAGERGGKAPSGAGLPPIGKHSISSKFPKKKPRSRRVFFALPEDKAGQDHVSLIKPPLGYNEFVSPSASQEKKKSQVHKKHVSNRWRQLLFKKHREKDSRILYFLQSRPPPPTVGPPRFLNLNEEDKINAFNEKIYAEVVSDESYIPLTDRVDGGKNAESEHSPESPDGISTSFTHLDFFGSSLHDYQQSDYRNGIFNENMLMC